MLVGEWMTTPAEVAESDLPLVEATQRLVQGGFRRLPVVRLGRLIGIVTARDLKEAMPKRDEALSLYELHAILGRMRVGEVASAPVTTVAAHDAIEEAAARMLQRGVSGLPVVDQQEAVVGIVTITDLLRAFAAVFGGSEGGVRVTVDVPDEPGVLARVAAAAAPSNIVATATASVRAGQERRLVLRVAGEGADRFAERLERSELKVVDVR